MKREHETAALGLEQVFHASPVAMSISRLDDCRVVEVNEAYLTTFGVSAEAIISRTPIDAGIRPPAGIREGLFQEIAEGRVVRSLELAFETPAGRKTILLSSRAIDVDGTPCALSTFVDITEQRRAVEEARMSDERFRELAESIHEVFWLTDPDNTTMLYVSPAYEKIFGRSCAALYADASDWLHALHPEDRERMSKTSHELGGGPCENVYRIIVGAEVRSIRINTFPVLDVDGKVIRIAGVAEDRTEQLQLEEQVRQTQKLESLGLLAGGVAHDFNNVLAVIGSNASLLTEAIPTNHPDRELIDEIESAVTRASSLTRQLLAFSRKEVIEPVVLDVNAAIADTRKMLRRMLGEDIVIETSLDPELHRTRIDPGYFVQVLMNLAVNSRDAMPRGGRLTITTRNAESHVRIEIADTGTGMPPEVKARVFEPFFTTKGVGKGTGLGLSVVHGIVQQAGGQITIESVPGAGTVICIELPLVDAPAERISDVALVAQVGTEKIILVDDDLFVRRATSRALRSRGYVVLEAADAGAALRLLNDHGADVALLLTDVVMPGTDGRELVQTARSHRPTLEVLYMSGYTDDAMLRHGLEHDQIPFIEKPFRSHALASKVRHLLDTKAKRVAISP